MRKLNEPIITLIEYSFTQYHSVTIFLLYEGMFQFQENHLSREIDLRDNITRCNIFIH